MLSIKAAIAALFVTLAVAVPQQAAAQQDQRDPTVQMFDNFFLSLVAARLCDNPDERTLELFTRNLLIVQEVTVNYFQSELPGRTRDDVFAIINNRAMALDEMLKSTIAEKGCADSDVINLVHMFDMHARMKLLDDEEPQP